MAWHHLPVNRRAAPALLLAMVSFGACATPMAPDRARVSTEITSRTRLETHGLPAPGKVWTAPPGATLEDGVGIDEAVAIALWNNPDFQVALSSLGIARADLIDAGLLKNPVLSLLFPWGPKQLEFVATFAVDQLWQRPKRVEDARLNAESNVALLANGGLRLIADVRLAFFESLAAERRLALATEQAAVAAQAARIAEGRLRAGDISEFEARLARTDQLRLEAARLTRVTARDVAIVRLRALLGLDPQAPEIRLDSPLALTAAGCQPGPELYQSAMATRPDVRAAEMQIEAAGARAGLEKGRIVAFTAMLDANGRGIEGFEMGPGIQIELPVLSQNEGRRARAAAEIEQSSRRYLAVRAQVSSEIATALIGLTEAQDTARLLGGDVAASLAAAGQQAEGLYRAGEISLLALLDTRQRLIEVELTRIDATFGVNRAIVRLEQAVGRNCAPR